jgi:predicted ATPase
VGAAEGDTTSQFHRWGEQASGFSQPLTVTGRSQRSRRNRETMSPDRLRRYQGQCQGSRPLLAPIYSGFAEGLDTADLQEAKALLEELS